jgi:molecular chaperone GrpE
MDRHKRAGEPGAPRPPAGAPKAPAGPAGVPRRERDRPTTNPAEPDARAPGQDASGQREGRGGEHPAEPDARASEEQDRGFESERAGAEDSAGVVERDLDELLAETKRERDEYLELARRTKADFENYRRRAAGDAEQAERRGRAELARQLVPVLDNLERALRASGIDPEAEGEASAGGDGGTLAHGVRLTYSDLRSTLERAGVEAYDPRGERFDPTWHEALATRAEEGIEPGVVVETVEKGYRLDGQVLRAARVVVSE